MQTARKKVISIERYWQREEENFNFACVLGENVYVEKQLKNDSFNVRSNCINNSHINKLRNQLSGRLEVLRSFKF
jgi:hypothetical protein